MGVVLVIFSNPHDFMWLTLTCQNIDYFLF